MQGKSGKGNDGIMDDRNNGKIGVWCVKAYKGKCVFQRHPESPGVTGRRESCYRSHFCSFISGLSALQAVAFFNRRSLSPSASLRRSKSEGLFRILLYGEDWKGWIIGRMESNA